MNGDNAVAGPSTVGLSYLGLTTIATPGTPTVHPTANTPTPSSFLSPYLPPSAPPPPRQHLASTQDLLSRLRLLAAYDKYVRLPQGSLDEPLNVKTGSDGTLNAITQNSGNIPNPISPHLDKGKGKEVLVRGGDVEMQDPNDADDDKAESKKRNSYKHLIRGIPGKHSTKKDDYLEKMMLVPPKQRMRIRRFDERTQEEAFSVTLEGLKGWNINTLIMESAQAREDRKKRKEAKKAAKLQAQMVQQIGKALPAISTSTSTQPQPLPTGSRTPKQTVGTPQPSAGVKPILKVGSTLPGPDSTAPKSATKSPVVARKHTPMEVDQHRGKKREREEGQPVVNGTHVNGGTVPVSTNGAANGLPSTNGLVQQKQPAVTLNARAGTGNVRPRPVKKQRVDVSGQARDVTAPVQQQPTPQGV